MNKTLLFGLLVISLIAIPLFSSCTTPAPTAPATTTAPTPTATQPPEVITLRFSTTMQASELPTMALIDMMDYVEKNSGGRVKFDRFFGATLGTVPDQLELLMTGGIDVATLMFADFARFPSFAMPMAPMDKFDPIDTMRKIEFETPGVSEIIQSDWTKNNIKNLGYAYTGSKGGLGIYSKPAAKSLADLKGKKIGMPDDLRLSAFQAMGFNAVRVMIPDVYESLSRGVVDAYHTGLAPGMQLKWFEVVDYYLTVNISTMNPVPHMMNLDTWNKLPPDIQKIFEDGAKHSQQTSRERAAAIEADQLKSFKNVSALPAADVDLIYLNMYKAAKQMALGNAQKIGRTQDIEKLWAYLDEFFGMQGK